MEKKKKVIDRLSFPTEFHNTKELKLNIVVLFLVCLAFFITSTIAVSLNLLLFTKALLVGTLGYELILFYLTFEYAKKFIKQKIKKEKTMKAFNAATYMIFGFLFLLTMFTLLYTMASVTSTVENKFASLLSALIMMVLPTFFWDEIVRAFDKRYFKYLKFFGLFGLIALLNLNGVLCQNETANATNVGGMDLWSTISTGLGMVSSFANMYNSFKEMIQTTFNLDPWASQMVMIILILVLAFMLFKFLTFVIKWVIVGLIIWVIAQMFLL